MDVSRFLHGYPKMPGSKGARANRSPHGGDVLSRRLGILRELRQRFLAWASPFPDVEVTLNPHDTPFNTKARYYYTDLDFGIDIIRIYAVELNLFIPGDRVPDDEILNVASHGAGNHLVHLIDFVLYGLKWESTVQAVIRCIGLDEAIDLDKWVMGDDFKVLTKEAFPFFGVPRQ